jgi:hypothetical protein
LTSENPPTPDRESPNEVVAGKLKRHAEEIVRMSDECLVMTSGAFDVRKPDLTRRLIVSNRELRDAIVQFAGSSAKAARRQHFTIALIVLTAAVVLLALTLVVLEFVSQRHIGHLPTAATS